MQVVNVDTACRLHRQHVRMQQLWNEVIDEQLATQLIALRIDEGTEASIQFSEIYPVPIVPASYLIDARGVPLDIITMTPTLNRDSFMIKLNRVANSIMQNTSTIDQTASVAATSTTTNASANSEQRSMEERVKYARELQAKKRMEDERKKAEEERQKEIVRRNEGKKLHETNQTQQDRELVELTQQRKKEKANKDADLKRLREQIAADRAERVALKASTTTTTELKSSLRRENPTSTVHAAVSPPLSTSIPEQQPKSNICRIQCRFPDGSTLKCMLTADNLLSDIINCINEDGRVKSKFYVVQMYPRREFTVDDHSKNLADLSLMPAAVLLVVPESGRSISTVSSSTLSMLISLFTFLIVSPLQYIYGLVFGHGGVAPVPSTQRNATAAGTRPAAPVGNVHRLGNTTAGDSDDDDNATWNGNSTQQL